MGKIRLLTAGESHGPKISCIIEGLPSGFKIDTSLIDFDLKRRQQGFGRGPRMKMEADKVICSAGVVNSCTTGSPVALEIVNLDYENWRHRDILPMTKPRPGHADYAGSIKYRHKDLRNALERASARESAIRCAAGSLMKQILLNFNIETMAYVTSIGAIDCNINKVCHRDAYKISLNNSFAFIDESKLDLIKQEIFNCMKNKNTLGGVFEVVALGVPPGLGSYVHFDRKLDGLIAQGLMSIPAMKAVEIGDGFANAKKKGTFVHDQFLLKEKKISRHSNRAGGIEAGVSNGMPIVARVYMKPISTTLTPLKTIDFASKQESVSSYERSDFCAVPRACVIGEAVLSYILLDALIDKLGGDNKEDMLFAFNSINKGYIDDLKLANRSWRFNYE